MPGLFMARCACKECDPCHHPSHVHNNITRLQQGQHASKLLPVSGCAAAIDVQP